ncbi:MAG: zinc ribbon domain-containing protein [Acidobacteriia bacterium]|nr:zinc ribbon domain-containing protein [Terriglobia bacterium]
MPEAAHNVQKEYWRPPGQPPHAMEIAAGQLICSQCGTEFVVGARFCHVCGSERESMLGAPSRWTQLLDATRIREGFGLSIGALLAFLAGMGCIVAAVATGFIYSAATVLDWQAVQIWRVEWLLAAAAALLAAILLKKADER